MLAWLIDWYVQRLARHTAIHEPIVTQHLFDYANDKWELLFSGDGSDRSDGLIYTFVDQTFLRDPDTFMVLIMQTFLGGGCVIAFNRKDRPVILTRWYMPYGRITSGFAFMQVVLDMKRKMKLNKKGECNGETPRQQEAST